MIEIKAIGGYDEVGRNMTAVKVDDEVFILDMGIELEAYIQLNEDEDIVNIGVEELEKANAIPLISSLGDWKDKVKAIIPTHAHLDHVGAIPYLINKFKAPVYCTPFTAEFIKTMLYEDKIKTKNPIKSIHPNSKFKVGNVLIEFIHVTHSTPHAVMVALHTDEGIVLYANDFKFDLYPVVGKKPNFKRLEELENVVMLITESTYAGMEGKMPSESVAKQMLKDVMLGSYSEGKAIVVTTFASHIARVKSIVEFAQHMGRKPLLLGRSFAKYIAAAEKVNLIDISKNCEILKYRSQINKKLNQVMKDGKEKYVLLVTGHQGEPKATLSRMARGETPFKFSGEDHVIFSSRTIPRPINIKNRGVLESSLKPHGVRLFKDIHVSGHAAREDLKDLLLMVKPKEIIPSHGELKEKQAFIELAEELGYKREQIHILQNGKSLKVTSSNN